MANSLVSTARDQANDAFLRTELVEQRSCDRLLDEYIQDRYPVALTVDSVQECGLHQEPHEHGICDSRLLQPTVLNSIQTDTHGNHEHSQHHLFKVETDSGSDDDYEYSYRGARDLGSPGMIANRPVTVSEEQSEYVSSNDLISPVFGAPGRVIPDVQPSDERAPIQRSHNTLSGPPANRDVSLVPPLVDNELPGIVPLNREALRSVDAEPILTLTMQEFMRTSWSTQDARCMLAWRLKGLCVGRCFAPPRQSRQESESNPDAQMTNSMKGEDNAESRSCPICLGNLDDNKVKVRELRCKHEFCVPCIDEWLSIDDTCPCCRGQVKQGQSGPSKLRNCIRRLTLNFDLSDEDHEESVTDQMAILWGSMRLVV